MGKDLKSGKKIKRSSSGKVMDLPSIVLARIQEADVSQAAVVDLSIRGLSVLPESIGQLNHLDSLKIVRTELTELPEALGLLSQLRSLGLARNQIESLPESIGQLSELQVLDLSTNRIADLPESVGLLTQLRTLNLSHNRLTKLPESFGRLGRLKVLNLSDNALTELPDSLQNMKSLTVLYLKGNPGLGLSEELLSEASSNPREILESYFKRKEGKRSIGEAKLILVGRGGVGKTSVVNRLLDRGFNEAMDPTHGIQIDEWEFRINGYEDVRLNVWDFGGQDIMHGTHQFFLTKRSLYLLVLSGREGDVEGDAEYWLKLIESFGDESSVILVLNKINGYPFDLNLPAWQQRYPCIRRLIKTDCKDETGIGELRKSIEWETGRLEHLRRSLPASWVAIRNELGRVKQKYLSFRTYRNICKVNGETSKAEQEALASYLHHLGIISNFRGDPRLEDTAVRDPRWVTRAIYNILNSEQVKERKGEIYEKDLKYILDTKEYPSHKHKFILDLMEKFYLCLSFQEFDDDYLAHRKRILIPELLDKQEPKDIAAFNSNECLRFQYHYSVLPEGLFPRFIVRTHELSNEGPRWRNGVVLNFEGNSALVKADMRDKKVSILVSGHPSGRRHLLAIVRSHFLVIHRHFRSLKPEEMLAVPGYPDLLVPYEKLRTFEQNGVKQFPEPFNSAVVYLDVQTLLNGIDDPSARVEDLVDETLSVQLLRNKLHV